MDLKFLKKPEDAYILPEEDLDNNAELPESFDAREQWPNCPSISYIRDQSSCGSCWAVSSAEVMSDRACIESDGRIKSHLSDSDIMTCCTDCGEDDGSYGGCKGGYLHKAFRYAMHKGVCTGGRYLEKSHLSDSDIMTCCTDCGEDDGSYGG
ncbi:papain family cysteine protease [Oesophagostomum dentatum]|uniref:Papain family cysteine protease n=1 Tax=Oesophagostomum dentatum TaxID=61180 RepID=A0A0B1SR28_OESDE|nr:papain family cysteine protease [Oesophagostomum dentatum]